MLEARLFVGILNIINPKKNDSWQVPKKIRFYAV